MEQEESNLVRARPVIVWILAVIVSFAAVGWIEKQSARVPESRQAVPAAAGCQGTP